MEKWMLYKTNYVVFDNNYEVIIIIIIKRKQKYDFLIFLEIWIKQTKQEWKNISIQFGESMLSKLFENIETKREKNKNRNCFNTTFSNK